MQPFTVALILAGAVYLIIREVDVRLVLFAAGLALASLALHPLKIFEVFLAEMGNGKTIGPICSAMGYSYVLRVTGCDRELVLLLLAPLRRARWLLIPGGCVAGFVTNIAITSQTAVAAAVGPILVPLMLAAGYSPIVAAATLVLGCSGGGSLFNPGDADLVAIQNAANVPMSLALHTMFFPLLGGFLTAVAVFTGWASRLPVKVENAAVVDADSGAQRQAWKALLPPLPVVLIFLMLPGFVFSSLPAPFEHGLPVSHAMIVSTIVVLLCSHRDTSKMVKSFFEGFGYAYTHVISLIITASCFIAGMTEVGLTEGLVRLVSGAGVTAKLAASAFPWSLAIISGSGIGPSVAFSNAVLPSLREVNLPVALDLGVLSAISATFGRTMSPVAAVVIFSGTLVGVPVLSVVKRTALPLIAGGGVALGVVLLRST